MFFCSSICFLIVFFDTMYLTDYVCHLDRMANTDPTFLCCFGSRFFPLCIGMQRTLPLISAVTTMLPMYEVLQFLGGLTFSFSALT